MEITPGHQAHDAYCRLDDWDQLDDETHEIWEDAAKAAVAAQAAVDRGGAS